MVLGKEIIDYFVNEIAKEGITEVQAWKEGDEKINRMTRDLLCNGEQSPTEVFSIEAETEEPKITETRRKSSVKGKKSKDGTKSSRSKSTYRLIEIEILYVLINFRTYRQLPTGY
jgi:hypothetical protein